MFRLLNDILCLCFALAVPWRQRRVNETSIRVRDEPFFITKRTRFSHQQTTKWTTHQAFTFIFFCPSDPLVSFFARTTITRYLSDSPSTLGYGSFRFCLHYRLHCKFYQLHFSPHFFIRSLANFEVLMREGTVERSTRHQGAYQS